MGKRNYLIVAGWLVTLTMGYLAFGQGEPTTKPTATPYSLLDHVLNPQDQKNLGLQKLSLDEKNRLGAFIMSLQDSHELDSRAFSYMRSHGFKPVSVEGRQRVKLSDFGEPQDCLIVSSDFQKWACGDTGMNDFTPGEYWAKCDAFGISEILTAGGESVSIFSSKEIPSH